MRKKLRIPRDSMTDGGRGKCHPQGVSRGGKLCTTKLTVYVLLQELLGVEVVVIAAVAPEPLLDVNNRPERCGESRKWIMVARKFLDPNVLSSHHCDTDFGLCAFDDEAVEAATSSCPPFASLPEDEAAPDAVVAVPASAGVFVQGCFTVILSTEETSSKTPSKEEQGKRTGGGGRRGLWRWP